MNAFQASVSALCYSISRARFPGSGSIGTVPPNQTVRFVLEQHARMPDYLRIPFAVVTLIFGASSLLRQGKFFHRLPHEARWRQIEAWRSAPLGPCRDMVRFYESFVIFHRHSVRLAEAGGLQRSRGLLQQQPTAAREDVR